MFFGFFASSQLSYTQVFITKMLSKKHQLFQPTQKATSPFKLLLIFSNGRGKSRTTWSWKNVSFSFFSFLSRSNQHLFYKIHIFAPIEPRFAICKVQVFPSIQPNPNNLFSSENQDFTNHPLSVPTDQVKCSNPTI